MAPDECERLEGCAPQGAAYVRSDAEGVEPRPERQGALTIVRFVFVARGERIG